MPKCTRSLACKGEKAHERSHHRYAETIRHSLRDGFTVSFALSPETWLFCLRHRRDAKHRRQLDTCLGVSGPHDFAVRADVVRLTTPSRPSHPALNVRDDAYAPLVERGTARNATDLGQPAI